MFVSMHKENVILSFSTMKEELILVMWIAR